MPLITGAFAENVHKMQNASQVPTTNVKVSYAQMAIQVQVPTKEQAIIIDAVDGISIQEYTRAVAKVTEGTNIMFASRISHGRVCIYLNSKINAPK